MRHLGETPEADQRRVIRICIHDFQRGDEGMPRVLDRAALDCIVVSNGISSRCYGLRDLEFYALLRPESFNLETVGQLSAIGGFCQLVVTGIEGARLPVSGNVDVGVLRKKEVYFWSEPGAVAARGLPIVACVIGARGFDRVEGGVGPQKILVAARREDSEYSAAVGQYQNPGSVFGFVELGTLVYRLQGRDQFLKHFSAAYTPGI